VSWSETDGNVSLYAALHQKDFSAAELLANKKALLAHGNELIAEVEAAADAQELRDAEARRKGKAVAVGGQPVGGADAEEADLLPR
jgi:hypothetical protein